LSSLRDYACKSCSTPNAKVKLVFNDINKYQCPNCGKLYIPKSKLKSEPKLESEPEPSYNFGYLSKYMERQRQELRREYRKENDYYDTKISSGLKAIDDDDIKRKKNDELEGSSSSSLIMSHKGIRQNRGRMTKYMKDRLDYTKVIIL
jgi:hypothetical protein